MGARRDLLMDSTDRMKSMMKCSRTPSASHLMLLTQMIIIHAIFSLKYTPIGDKTGLVAKEKQRCLSFALNLPLSLSLSLSFFLSLITSSSEKILTNLFWLFGARPDRLAGPICLLDVWNNFYSPMKERAETKLGSSACLLSLYLLLIMLPLSSSSFNFPISTLRCPRRHLSSSSPSSSIASSSRATNNTLPTFILPEHQGYLGDWSSLLA